MGGRHRYATSMRKFCACLPAKQKQKRLAGPPGQPPAEAPSPRLLHGILEITLDEVQTSGMPKLFRVSCLRYACNLLLTVLLHSCSEFSERLRDATNSMLLFCFLRVNGALGEKRRSKQISYRFSVHLYLGSIHKLKRICRMSNRSHLCVKLN